MKTELIPVIHVLNKQQVLRNAATCYANGIKKVFLINHAVDKTTLLECAFTVKEVYQLWVGINLLGYPIEEVISSPYFADALWCDQTLTKEKAEHRKFKGQLFTGVAFKYQPQPGDLKAACEEAKLYTDVATTSGVGTGKPANIYQMQLMRMYLGDHPMAIASGVSAENVHFYKGVADYLLVASSITDSNEIIVESKLKELLNNLA